MAKIFFMLLKMMTVATYTYKIIGIGVVITNMHNYPV